MKSNKLTKRAGKSWQILQQILQAIIMAPRNSDRGGIVKNPYIVKYVYSRKKKILVVLEHSFDTEGLEDFLHSKIL